MEKTQSFRLLGKSEIEEIPCLHVDEQDIVFWEDIEQVFPHVGHVKNSGVSVTLLRDSDGTRVLPGRIAYCQDVVLEVVLSTTAEHSPHLQSNSSSVVTDVPNQFSPARLDNELIQSGRPLHSENLSRLDDQQLVSGLTPMPEFQRDVIRLLEAIEQNTHATSELLKRMNDRLILIQRKTEAILTQNYELLEYTIPRLFIIIPENETSWDPATMFRTKFRLHFICECGKHTMEPGSKIPHELHLANYTNHKGYVVRQPTEFFKKYGPFLVLMLELFKQGTAIVSSILPVAAEATSKGIEYSLKYLEKTCAQAKATEGLGIDVDIHEMSTQEDLANYLAGVEGLEGTELRQLESYLSIDSSENLLGHMYRVTTEDGHVKWVCEDHYRTSYRMKHKQKILEVVNLQNGQFDEHLGKVSISLKSSVAATEFFDALSKVRGILELDIDLKWEYTEQDFNRLQGALKKSAVSALRLDLRLFRSSLWSKLSPTFTANKILFRLLELTNLKSIHIVLPRDLVRLSSLTPKMPPHLSKLSFDMAVGSYEGKEVRVLAEILRNNSVLTTLYLWDDSIRKAKNALDDSASISSSLTTLKLGDNKTGDSGVQVLAEALKTNPTLKTLTFDIKTVGDKGAQALAEMLKTNQTMTTLELGDNAIGEKGAQALAEALKTNSTLTTLTFGSNAIGYAPAGRFEIKTSNLVLAVVGMNKSGIGNKGAQALAEALKTNSTLTTLVISSNYIENEGLRALAKALRINSSLTSLGLYDNMVTRVDVLAETLKINSTLSALSLEYNGITSKEVQLLAHALKNNSTISMLNLGHNDIGIKGVRSLIEALKTNLTLTTLHLHDCTVEDSGAVVLSRALKSNSTLTTLSLGLNRIGNNGAQALGEALRTNSTLRTLLLFENSIGNVGARAMSEALLVNSTLTTLDLRLNTVRESEGRALRTALKATSSILLLL